MSFSEGLRGFLGFDKQNARYELLEREKGSPEHWTGWNDVYPDGDIKKTAFESGLDGIERQFRSAFRSDINTDVIFRRFNISGTHPAMLIYMNGMAGDKIISDFILRPLMEANPNAADFAAYDPLYLINNLVQISETATETDFNSTKLAVMDGRTALFTEGASEAVLLETRAFEKRSVTVPENERAIRGPKEGFTESIRTNITLVRKIIHSDDLVAEYRMSGGDNNTRIAILYRDGATNRTLVDEIKRRLAAINTRMVASTGIVEQLIEDTGLSPIPQILSTERPDRTASFIMQGAVALISEGSPFALVMPVTLTTLMSTSEDVYMRRPLGTMMRVIRYAGVILSLLLPGYFIALAMYHQGMLSTEVLSTVIQSRKMVFEPLPFEMILLLFVFQLIREAGMRVPGSVGQAIGVIGGLILGQAAVAANLASSVILIIVALSGLGNFCIPDYSSQISASYFRIAFVLAAWLGGLLGLVAAFMLFVGYISNLKSFGVPFLAPFAPKTYSKRPLILRGRLGLHHRGEDQLNTFGDTLEKKRD